MLKNKNFLRFLKILMVLFAFSSLGLFITRQDFSLNFYYSILPLSDHVRSYWFTENAYNLLVSGLLAICVLAVFRYKFRKEDNLNLTHRTTITICVCICISAAATFYAYCTHDYPWQAYAGEILKLLFAVSFFEELICRSYVTNELLSMKKHGLAVWQAIVISAILFGLIHLPAYFLYSEITLLGAIWRFVFPTILGLSYAVILYYTRDVLSLIFIHTTSNICGSLAGGPFDSLFFIATCLYAFSLYQKKK